MYYSSIKEETLAVRQTCGIFDVSHMGNILIQGEEAQSFCDFMITNSISDKKENQIIYSPLCTPEGGIVDDILVYKFNTRKLLLIVNASNKGKDFKWLNDHSSGFQVSLEDQSDRFSLLAVQGPESSSILKKNLALDLDDLDYYTFKKTGANPDCLISRTGYTGERGYELLVENSLAVPLWEKILKSSGCVPCGLGARDILRLEAAFPLYGQELSFTINPFESNLSRFVRLEKDNFLGKTALMKFKENHKNTRIGFTMVLNKIARQDSLIYAEDDQKEIGWVSSGTFSFNLGKSIGMGFINKNEIKSEIFQIKISDKFYRAQKVKMPFIKSNVKE